MQEGARRPAPPPTRAAVLVIAPDTAARRYVTRLLRDAGCIVVGATDPGAAAQAIAATTFSLLLLALDAAHAGWLAAARAAAPSTPLLVLLEDGGPEDVARLLDLGVDDCLPSPFHASDLVARSLRLLHLVTRRNAAAPEQPGELHFDLTRPRVRLAGHEIALTRLEYRLLWVLAQAGGAVLPFGEIERGVWGDTGAARRHALRRVMHNLRRKLSPGRVMLLTEPRIGYRLQLGA